MPHNVTAWKSFAQLETNVGETARARSIYELAVTQPVLDMPELLWKAYIDFEIGEQESVRVRDLYERLLERTGHVKVWTSYGQFEAAEAVAELARCEGADVSPEAVEAAARARDVFSRGYTILKQQELKEERVVLLEAWRSAESSFGAAGDVPAVENKLPRKIKMRRMVTAPDGSELGLEEYYDYNFPDDEKKVAGLKILENAMKWKLAAAAAAAAAENGDDDDGGDDDDNREGADDDEQEDDQEGAGAKEESGGFSMLGKRKAQDEEIDLEDL